MLDLLGHVGLLGGALLILVAAIGVLVFPDSLTRMHALSMGSTAGVALSLIGIAVAMGSVAEVTSLLFAAALQAATNPVASTLLAQATYYAGGIATRVDAVDELAERSNYGGESVERGQ
jgi:multicomponent Na+:H+ antiporter subunit G